jgi:hypothetical protein
MRDYTKVRFPGASKTLAANVSQRFDGKHAERLEACTVADVRFVDVALRCLQIGVAHRELDFLHAAGDAGRLETEHTRH